MFPILCLRHMYALMQMRASRVDSIVGLFSVLFLLEHNEYYTIK